MKNPENRKSQKIVKNRKSQNQQNLTSGKFAYAHIYSFV